LDVLTAKKLRTYIAEWAKRGRKGTILLTTHYMAEADEMCDRVAIIDQGRIMACNRPYALKEKLKENSIMRLEVSSMQADLSFLEKTPGVVGFSQIRNIQTDTTTLRIMVRNQTTLQSVTKKLEEQKLRVLAVDEVEPTLEDVYICLVGRGLEEE
jgi:ABC-2 type transport system ATP-binding protein